ncbi:cysteine-rich repeat secretory protein 55 [Apium graveolens]|uniref:cysteine-rich repeat secretory protein 55 n=1 Tax=Apium graveolens TaxID=4045 RepID=UPI003D7B0734
MIFVNITKVDGPICMKIQSMMNMLYYLVFLLFLCICISTSENVDSVGNFCNNDRNISSSTISENVNSVSDALVHTAAKDGFASASYGKAKNVVYGLAQCRGDVSSKDCSDCVQDAAKEIRKVCPGSSGRKDMILNILSRNLARYLTRRIHDAVVTGSKGLGKASSKISTFVTLYALSQCTRDLPELSCAQCLTTALTNFDGFCDNKKGCRVLYSSCFVRYEEYPFYFPLETQNSNVSNYVSMASKP